MSDLIDTGEMYLKTVYELEEEGVVPLRARIAERLGHSGPTVSETVARLARDGLMTVSSNRQLEFTDEGRELATEVMRKHRLAERLLIDVIGMEWEYAHEEACRWEHVMSDRVADQLKKVLSDTDTDPYGNPIPYMEAGPGNLTAPIAGLRSLVDYSDEDRWSAAVTIARFAEPLQTDQELLARLRTAGIMPGAAVNAERLDDDFYLEAGESVSVPYDLARHIFVA